MDPDVRLEGLSRFSRCDFISDPGVVTFVESTSKFSIADFLRTFGKSFQHVQVSLLVHGLKALLRRCKLGLALIPSMLDAVIEFLLADVFFVFGEFHVGVLHVLLVFGLKTLLRRG